MLLPNVLKIEIFAPFILKTKNQRGEILDIDQKNVLSCGDKKMPHHIKKRREKRKQRINGSG